ncbi:hypothetical protein B0T09DRAFT_32196 [Sordaria sp. MPI-SDFR-AT-0083]|nr:hypothetical protein B0T09DRAFT_32196 [Sordaria sp. MPI-SDFR-AT-0083]
MACRPPCFATDSDGFSNKFCVKLMKISFCLFQSLSERLHYFLFSNYDVCGRRPSMDVSCSQTHFHWVGGTAAATTICRSYLPLSLFFLNPLLNLPLPAVLFVAVPQLSGLLHFFMAWCRRHGMA